MELRKFLKITVPTAKRLKELRTGLIRRFKTFLIDLELRLQLIAALGSRTNNL